MTALSIAALPHLPAAVARPGYDVANVGLGIVHLGLGAFHRAHQAVYTDGVLAQDPRWGICGVNLKTPRASAELTRQDGLYTVLERSAGRVHARVVGALREALFLGSDRQRVMARFADPGVSVVTLTVTEKGYCHDPAAGRLDVGHPDIAHDLVHLDVARSAVGVLVAGLAARRAAGVGALSVVCCDNLLDNGHVVEAIVGSFAQARDVALADWIATHVVFPCTMVDRIVPATTGADIADAARLLGVEDAVPVATESFNGWVIENRFAGRRPPWERAGAQVVDSVAPFERMKLRLLNGSHSALAYLGFLSGHDYIWQAASDPQLAALIERMMKSEIVPTLTAPPGVDLAAYCGQVLARFRNSGLPHRTQQVAMDGSQKLPQRLLDTVRDRLEGGGSIQHLALAIAGWVRYASGIGEDGRPIATSDPLSPRFAAIAAAAKGNAAHIADGFLDLAEVFGDLASNDAFRKAVARDVGALLRDGVRRTLSVHLAQPG